MVAASKAAIFCTLALIASANVIAGADIKCTTATDCQTAGKYDYYCTADNTCKQYTSVDSDPKSASFEICKDTFFQSGSTCYNLAQLDCEAKTSEVSIQCFGALEKKSDKCAWREEAKKPDEPTAKEGDRCVANSDKAGENCQNAAESNGFLELFCNRYSLCERKNKVGEKCSTNNACESNTLCNFGICTAAGSIGDGQRSSSAPLCESGMTDTADVCKPTYADANYGTACFSNSDCSNVDGGVCDVSTKDAQGRGKCIAFTKPATLAYNKCKSQRCNGAKNLAECDISASLCAKEWARTVCDAQCKKIPSERTYHAHFQAKTKANEGKGYSVDCKALTVSTIPDNSCKLGPNDIYKNCDAVVADAATYPRSSADKVAASFMAVVLALVAAMAMLL